MSGLLDKFAEADWETSEARARQGLRLVTPWPRARVGPRLHPVIGFCPAGASERVRAHPHGELCCVAADDYHIIPGYEFKRQFYGVRRADEWFHIVLKHEDPLHLPGSKL